MIHTGRARLLLGVEATPRRHHDDLDADELRVIADRLTDLDAAESWHHPVQDHDLWTMLLDLGKRLVSVLRLERTMPPERPAHQDAQQRCIIGDHNPCHSLLVGERYPRGMNLSMSLCHP